MQLTGLMVVSDNGTAVSAESMQTPGVAEIREALACIERGHHVKALDLLFDGAVLFAEHKGVTVPWDS